MESLDMPVGQLEGSLPPCLRIAVFDGYVAHFHDCSCKAYDCNHRFHIHVARISRWGQSTHPGVGQVPLASSGTETFEEEPDDPEEAERLWLEAQEVLRNGGAE